MSYRNGKVDLAPRRHHGYAVVLLVFGMLFPPLAVAARFGVGKDFWLNLLLTICGYIPGHGHNFYIQNIRNNKNRRHTPKWVQKYGLADVSKIERDQKKREWALRYNDRMPHSVFEGQEYAEGEIPDRLSQDGSVLGPDSRRRREGDQRGGAGERLWNEEEERYYGQRASRSNGSLDSASVSTASAGGGGRWHYPANFEDTLPTSEPAGKKKKMKKKDRWARTEDAYNAPPSTKKRKSKKSKVKNHSTVGGGTAGGAGEYDRRSNTTSLDDEPGFPEDPEGGLYSDRRQPTGGVDGVDVIGNGVPDVPNVGADGRKKGEFEHEF